MDPERTDQPKGDDRPTRERTLTQKGKELFDTSQRKLHDKLKPAWELVQGLINECESCPNDLISLRKVDKSLSRSYDRYRSITEQYVSFLARANTPEGNDELERLNIINETRSTTLENVKGELEKRIDLLIESASQRSQTSKKSAHSDRKSTLGSMIVRKLGVAEAAKAQAAYAVHEAELRKRHAIIEEQQQVAAAAAMRQKVNLEAEMTLLQEQKHAAVADAELKAVQSVSCGSHNAISELSFPIENSKTRTKDYIDKHQFGLDTDATTFTPRMDGNNGNPELRPLGNQITTANDFTRFLLKRELLLTRLSRFEDTPETYTLWKSGFQTMMEELQVNPSEELDLLTKWLGRESSQHARSLRAANARDPTKALHRIWERLNDRYGCPEMIESAIKAKLSGFPKLNNKDTKRLYELCDILSEIESMKEDVTYKASLSYYDTSSGVIPIVNKLPYGIQEKWTTQASRFKLQNQVTFPPFSFFVEFMKEIAKTKNDPSFMHETANTTPKSNQTTKTSVNNILSRKTDIQRPSSSVRTDINPEVECPIHKTKHPLTSCRKFEQMPLEERKKLIKEFGICFKCCASTSHMFRDCRANVLCAKCGSNKHPSVLHRNSPYAQTNTEVNPTQLQTDFGEEKTTIQPTVAPPSRITTQCTQICGTDFEGKSCGKTIQVRVYPKGKPQAAQNVYAIIDDQSNASLAKSVLFDMFGIQDKPIPYTLSSCAGLVQMSGRKGFNFVVESLDGTGVVNLHSVIECNRIPNVRREIPTPEVALHHPHLVDIANEIPPLRDDVSILLLIGRDAVEAHHVLDHRIGLRNAPYAQKLRLGWTIIGESCLGKVHRPDVVNVNKTYLLDNGRTTILPPCPNNFEVKQSVVDKDLYNNTSTTLSSHPDDQFGSTVFELTKNDYKMGSSIEDKQFFDIMDNEFRKDNEGNWIAPLPFKDPRPRLPNNRQQAVKRAKSLHNSLQKDPLKREHFTTFMGDILSRNHAELAPALEDGDECWYLPLFGVYRPKKPEQIRGVFDASAQFEGVSLNSVLLSGPDLTNSLLGILIRFRQEPVAITGDIQQMFHCFLVTPAHRNFLRFLWYKNNNPDLELIEYRMRVHVFGNCSSPAVATYGVRRAASECENVYGSDVKKFVHEDFYVDDALTSLSSADQAIDLMKRTQNGLKEEGNIRLHKITSNNVCVMEAFCSDDRAKDLKNLDLGADTIPLQRSLGLYWDLKSDTFRFQVKTDDKPYTKRGVLSTICSLFDPLGFVAPVLVHGRIILRELMSEKTDWDEDLPAEFQREWEEWKQSLKALDDIQIPRTYLGASLQMTKSKELHIFSDASEKAIAAVAYLKATNDNDDTRAGFVLGKSKVAPTHGHTIPRLELCAAVLVVEIGEAICDHLNIALNHVKFYTDSKIVLGYIYNQTRRFYVYVSNRVARIRRSTEPDQWRYISSDHNPADQATRSLSSTDLGTSAWLRGPSALSKVKETAYSLQDPASDKEVRPTIDILKTSLNCESVFGSQRFERFSSWARLVYAVSILKQFASTYHKSGSSESAKSPDILEYRAKSEQFVLRVVQAEVYPDEISALKQNATLSKNSTLSSLNPFLDKNGLLRVGGRLNRSQLDSQERNPCIVPSRHWISTLLVRHYHQKVQHQGRHFTEGAIRSAGLWIVGVKRQVSLIMHHCVTCRKLRGKEACPKMADIPVDRTIPSPPFTFVGVDVFGPWPVVTRRTRGGQANSKRWAVLFTCLTTRAIHIEVVEEMSSSSFINSLRRFMAIRCKVRIFRSDRGTNFIGATEDLKIDAFNIEEKGVKTFLYENGSKLIFNPPHSSHMGGVWERMIGITRRILDSMLLQANTRTLTHEVLCTFLAEVTAIVNARPLVPVSTDPECPTVLSPAILLTQKTDHSTDLGENLDIRDIYRFQWKHVQVLSENFWKRWRLEYLQSLQPRRKWRNEQPNVKEDDVVLLKDKDVHRNEWPVGIISNVFPSDDGKVRTVKVRVIKDGKPTTYLRPITDVVVLLS